MRLDAADLDDDVAADAKHRAAEAYRVGPPADPHRRSVATADGLRDQEARRDWRRKRWRPERFVARMAKLGSSLRRYR